MVQTHADEREERAIDQLSIGWKLAGNLQSICNHFTNYHCFSRTFGAVRALYVVECAFLADSNPSLSAILSCRRQSREDSAKGALYLRSVCWISTAFHGLGCHPLTCILLKIRLNVDSSPT